jgi:uncharacterized protein (TIGR01777 family)
MRIIVTGGTGFIGRRLVTRFVGSGHAVTVLTRDVESAVRRLPALCAVASWNPPGALDPALVRGADAIVHLAGEGVAGGRWTPKRKQAIRVSRVASTRALARAVRALPIAERPRTVVSASAVGIYGDRSDAVVDEQSPPGEGFLAEVCRSWERQVLALETMGIRTVAVRVGIVLGRDGGALARMLLPFRLGAGGRLGSGKQWMSWIHIDDVVALFAHVLENQNARGPINGVAPHPVTNETFARELGRALGRPALLPAPAFALRALLGEMSTMLLGGHRVLPRAAQHLGFVFRFPELSAALVDLCADSCRELTREQWLARPPEEVFPFFSDPYNLERITPDFLRFRVDGMDTAQVQQGTSIDYRLAVHGLPMRWRSRIDSWQPNRSFVDVQTRGPYDVWHHTHEFEPANGGTIVRDRVRYALPFGALGELVAGGLVERDLAMIFDVRRARMEEALAARS